MENNVTEMERKWLKAVYVAELANGNPLAYVLADEPNRVNVGALRSEMRERGLSLTCDHSASSYGIPVMVDEHGNAYGPGEWIGAKLDLRAR
jgi:hypothetical protein